MIIVVIAYNRPHYLQRTLASLSKVHGIEQVQVNFQLDSSDSLSLAYSWQHPRKSIMVNEHRLGCNWNVYRGLERAFGESDIVGVIEDDLEVSTDWLDFIMQNDFRKQCYAVCMYRKHESPPILDWTGYEHVQNFCAWSWLTWRERWEGFKNCWDLNPEHISWDTCLNNNFFSKKEKAIIMPNLGRCFNFGEIGQYCSSKEEYLASNFTPYWAGKALLGDAGA